MKKLGFIIEKKTYIRTNWQPDIIGKAADGSTLVIEVKSNRIGIPDVLAIASTASSGSQIGQPITGAIVSTVPTPQAVTKIAGENDVTILTVDKPGNLESRLTFLGLLARIESRVRKASESTFETKLSDVITDLDKSKRLPPDVIHDVEQLWEVRNSLTHDVGEKDVFDEKWIGKADSTLNRLDHL